MSTSISSTTSSLVESDCFSSLESEHGLEFLENLHPNHPCFHVFQTGLEEGELSFISETFGPPEWFHLAVKIIYCIVCLVGLTGNILVVYVIGRFSKMRTVPNLYIANLAIADVCFLIGIPFLVRTAVIGEWPFGRFLCKAYFASTSINQITNCMLLLCMSADRYMRVCHQKGGSAVGAGIIIGITWTLSAILLIPIVTYANILEIDGKTNCNIFWPDSDSTDSYITTGEARFIIYSFSFGYAIPGLLTFIFCILLILRAVRGGRFTLSDKQIQETRLALIVIAIFLLFWAPYWAVQMYLGIFMDPYSNHSNTVLYLFLLAGCLAYAKSAVLPMLYGLVADDFRESYEKVFCCAATKSKREYSTLPLPDGTDGNAGDILLNPI